MSKENYYFFSEADSIFIMKEDEFNENCNKSIELGHSHEIGKVITRSVDELLTYLIIEKWSDKEIYTLVDNELIKSLNLKL